MKQLKIEIVRALLNHYDKSVCYILEELTPARQKPALEALKLDFYQLIGEIENSNSLSTINLEYGRRLADYSYIFWLDELKAAFKIKD